MRRVLVIGLFAFQAALLLYSLRQNFITIDEPGHFAAGISNWDTGTFGMYRVNPPVARMLAVLPPLLANPERDYQSLKDEPGYRSELWVGRDLAAANASRFFDFICLARLAGVGWALLGGWIIYCWASSLYGKAAGCLSLGLWTFSPMILGHAQLLTPDVPATVAGLGATYVFWRYLRRASWELAFFAGLLLGVAELTKFTLLALYPVWMILWVMNRFTHHLTTDHTDTTDQHGKNYHHFIIRVIRVIRGEKFRLGTAAAQLIFLLLLSVYVINMGYFFQGSCSRCATCVSSATC